MKKKKAKEIISQISKIKSEARQREKKHISEDIKKRPAQELIDNKGEFKRRLYSKGSKVESGVDVVLSKATQKLGQLAKKKMKTKKILKKSKMTYIMPSRQIENVFHDENRFFKGAIQNEF